MLSEGDTLQAPYAGDAAPVPIPMAAAAPVLTGTVISDFTADERKVFRAVGKAHVKNNLSIFTHNNYGTGPNVPREIALRQLDVYESVGVNPRRIAIGHLLTEVNPNRLAVFFPALVFGWLRSRTRGIGAGVVFHALCNLYASYLARSYGLMR